MPLKSRKKSSKRPSPTPANQHPEASTSKASSTNGTRPVLDTAVLERAPRVGNTSAFKPPARVPLKLPQLNAGARTKLVTQLIEHPEPAPPADIATTVNPVEPTVRRFHGR